MKMFRYKKLTKKDYGRIAIICLLVGGMRSIVQIQFPLYILMLTDILLIVGFASGLIWIFKGFVQKDSSFVKYCERCGDLNPSCVYRQNCTDGARNLSRITSYYPFDEPIYICFGCFALHESLVNVLTMLVTEKSQKFGRFKEIELVEKDFGDEGIFVLSLLYLAYDNNGIESVKKVLDKSTFEKNKSWLESNIKNKTK